ncbi:MAG TPA: sugar ABC transporter permease [Kineosporiaceae bacterium]|nr:sugar ABC transporter permease [Kineosporiaceae bacterium]
MQTTVSPPVSAPDQHAPRNASRRSAGRRRGSANHPLTFLVPAFAMIVIFFVVPTVMNFIYPFTNWSAFKPGIQSAGLSNFRDIINDGTLVSSLKITLIYAVLVALFQNLFGLGLALLLERDTRVNRFARALFFLPVLMSALAVGYVFQAMLKPDGALNSVLSTLLGHEVAVEWLGSTTWTIVTIALVHAWKWMGLAMLVYLAGLKTIPEDLQEAARIDGAGRWKAFWHIRLPLLAPAVTFNVATALLGTMNGFDVVQATTGGGPARSTEVLNIFIFRTFGQGLYAQSTAMSLVLFLSILVLAVPLVLFLRRREQII